MNYQKELSKVVPIFQYRNVLVEKVIGGFMVMGKKCKTMEQVDDLIDESLRTVGKSIVTVENKGSINCQNDNV